MRFLALAILVLLAMPLRVAADPPTGPAVVASIAPVHSLVARVMQGVGAPYLLLPPGASPHDHALRPSDAAALDNAALVFQVTPALEPWLDRPLASLAGAALIVRLADTPGLTRLPRRIDTVFDEHAHDHGETDPHLWLDPRNAGLWLGQIASALAQTDPVNRDAYLSNAGAAAIELDQLSADIAALTAPLRNRPFVVLHDGFHYFEHRFDIEAAGAVALSDARAPGPARIARIRAHMRDLNVVCLFREPQFRARLAETVAQGTGARIGVLDPLGAGLQPGPGLYPDLLMGIANGLADCLI